MGFIRPRPEIRFTLLLDPHGEPLNAARGVLFAVLLSAGFWLGLGLALGG